MAIDLYNTVKDCPECIRIKTFGKGRRLLPLFLPGGTLKFVVMDIRIPLPRTSNANKFLSVTMDLHLNLTRAVPMSKTTFENIASMLIVY